MILLDIFEYAKKEFEKRYDSRMTVQENKPVKDGAITKTKWVDVDGLINVACRIAQKRVVNPASESEQAIVSYITTLYCDPSLNIKVGSRIAITDVHGVKRDYKRSSEGFSSYRTHQEIVIVREVIA